MSALMQQAEQKRADADAIQSKLDALTSMDELTDAQQKQITSWQDDEIALREDADRLEREAKKATKLEELRSAANQPRERKTADKPGDELDIKVTDPRAADPRRGFKDDRDFALAVIKAGQGHRVDDRLLPLQAAVGSDEHGTFDDAKGGFLVPTAFSPNVKTLAAEADPLKGLVQRVPMAAVQIGIPARVDKNHQTSVSGGLTVTRRAETGAGSSSTMELEKVELKASMLWGLAYITEELLTDSPISFAALLERGFDDEFGARLLDERLNGTGVGEFLGVNNAPCLETIAKESGQAADTIVGLNILKMRQQCWRYGQAIWLANHDCYIQLAQAHIAGTNGDVFLFRPGNGVDVPDTLLGRPIIFTEFAETLGDAGDLSLGVWGEYLEGEYEAPGQAESMHVRFENHERAFKFWVRNAGAPWWRSGLTPKRGANTIAPFLRLAARA